MISLEDYLSAENKKAQFLRFAIIGIFAFLIHYFIYWVCYHFMSEGLAYTLGYCLSFIANFYFSSKYTFRCKATVKRGVGFAAAHGINYLNQILLLHLFLWTGVNRAWAPMPVNCIAVPINFLLVRFVFCNHE